LRWINGRHPFVLTVVVPHPHRKEIFTFAAAGNSLSGEIPACLRDDDPLHFAAVVRVEIEKDPILFRAEFDSAMFLVTITHPVGATCLLAHPRLAVNSIAKWPGTPMRRP
jgi:hypothetical protein